MRLKRVKNDFSSIVRIYWCYASVYKVSCVGVGGRYVGEGGEWHLGDSITGGLAHPIITVTQHTPSPSEHGGRDQGCRVRGGGRLGDYKLNCYYILLYSRQIDISVKLIYGLLTFQLLSISYRRATMKQYNNWKVLLKNVQYFVCSLRWHHLLKLTTRYINSIFKYSSALLRVN